MLCYAMLCCAVLCCAVQCNAMPCPILVDSIYRSTYARKASYLSILQNPVYLPIHQPTHLGGDGHPPNYLGGEPPLPTYLHWIATHLPL